MRKIGFLSFLIFIAQISNAQWTNGTNINNTNTGNVGIGTTAPDQKLTIKGGGIGFDGNSGDKKLYSPADGVLEWMTHDLAGERAFAVSHQGTKRVYLSTLGNSYLMGGNLGIGTTNPQGKLHVKNGIIMAGDPSFDNINVRIDGNSTPVVKFTRWTGTASTQHNAFIGQFYNSSLDEYSFGIGTGYSSSGDPDAAANVLTTTLGGNVGIGITNPTVKLDINGAAKASGIVQSDTYLYSPELQLGSGASNSRFVVSRETEYDLSIKAGMANYAGLKLKDNTGTQIGWWRSTNTSLFSVANGSNQDQFVVTSVGNIGIGTTDTKGYKLAVNGDAIFTKVKVKQYTSWPDYVFHPCYKLPSLKDLEEYIQKNNHLPDVLSAKEVEENGLDLGANQAALLKKIEELTLYIIAQDKKIEGQNKLIKNLEDQNKELLSVKKDIEIIKASLKTKN